MRESIWTRSISDILTSRRVICFISGALALTAAATGFQQYAHSRLPAPLRAYDSDRNGRISTTELYEFLKDNFVEREYHSGDSRR